MGSHRPLLAGSEYYLSKAASPAQTEAHNAASHSLVRVTRATLHPMDSEDITEGALYEVSVSCRSVLASFQLVLLFRRKIVL